MIVLHRLAHAQVANLRAYYEELDRPQALANLRAAIQTAADRIAAQKGPFYTAPRPYPMAVRPGWQWLKAGSYWIAFVADGDDFIVRAVFHESADITNRLPR